MKKILGILLTAVMLLTSMGVWAAEEQETVLRRYTYGFEDNETNRLAGAGGTGKSTYSLVGAETYGADTPEDTTDDYTVTPHSGEKMLKAVNVSDTNNMPFREDVCINLEPDSKYRVSFWYYSPVGESPFIQLTANGNYIYGPNRNFLGKTTAKTWTKFEFDFVTNSTSAGKLDFRFMSNKGHTEYYDDFCAEKVEMGSVSFWNGVTVNPMSNTNWFVNTNGTNFGNLKAQQSYQMTVDGVKKDVWVYPDWARGVGATAFTGNISILSHYVPKTKGEKVMLIAAIMKDNADGEAQLCDVVLKPYEYGTTNITSAKTWYTDHTRFNGGLNVLTLDASKYEAGCYVKAYVWSSLSGLTTLSGIATLPAA